LRKERNDADAEFVGIWHVASDEIDFALLKCQQKSRIAGKTI